MSETPITERVEKGIRWLTEHDPDGAFHLWFIARITPGTPMPAQPVERQQEYRTYYKAREQWERLWNAMVAAEGKQA